MHSNLVLTVLHNKLGRKGNPVFQNRWPWTAVVAANFVTNIWAFIPSEEVLNKLELIKTSLLFAQRLPNDSYF